MVALAIGTGVGVNALLARTLGQGNREKGGKRSPGTVCSSARSFISSVCCSVWRGAGAYIASQTADAQVIGMTHDYLFICCTFSFGVVFFSLFEKLLQATGRSLYSTIGQITGAVINIVLDPVMIYGLGGVPELGVRGAAWATVIGQVASAVLLSYSICASTASLTAASIRTAYGLFYKVQQFVLFSRVRPARRDHADRRLRLRQWQPEARRGRHQIRSVLHGCAHGGRICADRAVPGARSPRCSMRVSRGAYFIGAMRVISLSFVFAGINIALQGVYQALGGGMESLVLSLLRQFVIVLPLAYAFSLAVRSGLTGVSLIWWAIPIAEALSCAAGCVLLQRIRRKNLG